jgi:sugar transferase (PEP-CTERM/EpsH1 system associated)
MRVLFLTHRLPYAPNRGDRLRAYHIVRNLIARGMKVDVLSLVHDKEELGQLDLVRGLGAGANAVRIPRFRTYASGALALAGTRPLTHALLTAPGFNDAARAIVREHEPDVVLAYCSSMARFALEPPLDRYPLVIDLVDVDSQKWAALATTSSLPRRWIYSREERYLSRFEGRAAERAFATLVVNDREATALRQLAPAADVRVVPVGVDLASLRPPGPPTEAPRIVFCGVMNYEPNVEGILWFTEQVWPKIRATQPNARFHIVGSDPAPAIVRVASPGSGIYVSGEVESVQPYLWESALSVAPLKTARGVQNKVLEAVAAGLPAVVTPQVYEGLPHEIRDACLVGDSPSQFAEQALTLLAMGPGERRAMATRAACSRLDWSTQLTPLYEVLRNAALRPATALASSA